MIISSSVSSACSAPLSAFPIVPIRPREDVQDLRAPLLAVLARFLGFGDCFQQASAVIIFEPRIAHHHRHAIVSFRLGRLLVLQEGNRSTNLQCGVPDAIRRIGDAFDEQADGAQLGLK